MKWNAWNTAKRGWLHEGDERTMPSHVEFIALKFKAQKLKDEWAAPPCEFSGPLQFTESRICSSQSRPIHLNHILKRHSS